jgi:hypothetical protein
MKIKQIQFIIAFSAITVFICSCSGSGNEEKARVASKDSVSNPMRGKSVIVKTFQNNAEKNNLEGFGYDIYIDSSFSPTVHQPNIPAVPGNRGFANENDAKRVGELVASKVKNNIMPPSITVAELDSLGIK